MGSIALILKSECAFNRMHDWALFRILDVQYIPLEMEMRNISEMGNYLHLFCGDLYKKYPGLWKRKTTRE